MYIPKPFTISKRGDYYRITLNHTSGLPDRICAEWKRRSFNTFPEELFSYSRPKSDPAADRAGYAVIAYLQKKVEEGNIRYRAQDITVGKWVERFTNIEMSPRTGYNASKNKPFSHNTLYGYKIHFEAHIKDDPIAELKMIDVDEQDIRDYTTRLSVKKFEKKDGAIGGSRTFEATVSFLRTCFNEYYKINKLQNNPFQYIPVGKADRKAWDALSEGEILKLFMPGVLKDTLELAVCAAIFLCGLRRGEVAALRPEDLDWVSGKITVNHSWQRFDSKEKVLGPPKGKKSRKLDFDPMLQNAIKKLWAENGQHEFVFSTRRVRKDGKVVIYTIGPQWTQNHFKKWLERAKIELGGRQIVPHSGRHSIASLLLDKGVSVKYIQDFLGHANLKTTINYLHSLNNASNEEISKLGTKITEVMNKEPKVYNNIVQFRAS